MGVYEIAEGMTTIYTTTLVSETSVAILLAQFTALTLTYYDLETGTVINGRNSQNVLNANNVTVHATSGLLTWVLQPADAVILRTDLEPGMFERHRALFRWTYNTPAQYGFVEEDFLVQQIEYVG